MSEPGAKSAVLHQRVGWLELFYDLVFVVVIERLTHLVHGEPSTSRIWLTIGLTAVVWFAWFNVTALTNVSGEVGPRGRPFVFLSMAGIGVLALGVHGVPQGHLWLFVLGYSIARTAIWPLWHRGRLRSGQGVLRPLFFGPLLGAAWLTTAWLPSPKLVIAAWSILVMAEMSLTLARPDGSDGHPQLHGPHLVERIGLLLMIVLGEGVVQIVNALDIEDRRPIHWATAALAMALLRALWWLVYDATVSKVETAMDADDTSVADFIGGSQLGIVAGLVLMAAGMADAIHAARPQEGTAHLHAGSLTCLCLGLLMVCLGAQSLARRAFAANLGLPMPSQRTHERGKLESPDERRRRQEESRQLRQWRGERPGIWPFVAAIGEVVVFFAPLVLVWVFGEHLAPWLVLTILLTYVIATVAVQALGARRLTRFVADGGFATHASVSKGAENVAGATSSPRHDEHA